MKSIMLVTTQMQLLNCIELVSKYDKKVDLLIVICHSRSRREQLEKLLKIEDLRKFITEIKYIILKKEGISSLTSQISCKFQLGKLAKLYKYDECIIGNNFPTQNRFFIYKVMKNNPNCKLFVCDDGLATLSSYKNRLLQLKGVKNAYPKNSRALEIVYMFSGVDNYVPKIFNYFTVYNLEDNFVDKYIQNTYEYLRSHLRSFYSDGDFSNYSVIILGLPMIQYNILDKNSFNKYIRNILNLSPNHKALYIMHPQETIDEQDFDVDIIGQIKAVKLDYPVETLLSVLDNKIIYGFYTSALVNLKYMNLNSSFYAVRVKEVLDKNDEYSKRIESVYQYLLGNGIQII